MKSLSWLPRISTSAGTVEALDPLDVARRKAQGRVALVEGVHHLLGRAGALRVVEPQRMAGFVQDDIVEVQAGLSEGRPPLARIERDDRIGHLPDGRTRQGREFGEGRADGGARQRPEGDGQIRRRARRGGLEVERGDRGPCFQSEFRGDFEVIGLKTRTIPRIRIEARVEPEGDRARRPTEDRIAPLVGGVGERVGRQA